jgi:hypothetical protein
MPSLEVLADYDFPSGVFFRGLSGARKANTLAVITSKRIRRIESEQTMWILELTKE